MFSTRPINVSSRSSVAVKASPKEETIYIGKGRTVKDDPKKYPDRTPLTGGWAGGEAGLWQFREEAVKSKSKAPAAESKAPKSDIKVAGSGADVIYVGKGRYIKDNAQKYPDRTPLTGGFAGGERGLKTFVETGDIPMAPPGTTKSPASSPVFVAILVGAAGLLGLVLQDATDVAVDASGPSGVALKALSPLAAVDPATQPLLQAGVGLALLSLLAGGGYFALKGLTEKVASGAEYAVKTAALVGAVLFAAKIILEY